MRGPGCRSKPRWLAAGRVAPPEGAAPRLQRVRSSPLAGRRGTRAAVRVPPRLRPVGERVPLDGEVDALVVSLVDIAINETLAVCAGAGISRGAGPPDGGELARRLHARFEAQFSGYSCDKPSNLLAVAEAAASVRGGLEAVQRVALQLAPFHSVPAQPAHLCWPFSSRKEPSACS